MKTSSFFNLFKKTEKENSLLNLISSSNIFDAKYYTKRYQDVTKSHLSAIEHFVEIGIDEHRNPNSEFDVQWYYETNIDVRESNINPIIHYIEFGRNENRVINKKNELITLISNSGILDEKYYYNFYKDVKESHLSALEHFVEIGIDEYRNPNSEFDVQWYYEINADVQETKINPIVHYIKFGKDEGRKPAETENYLTHVNSNETKLLGDILEYKNGKIYGWYYSTQHITPLLLINNHLCHIVETNISMPHIAEKFDLDRDFIGFIAEVLVDIQNAYNFDFYAIFKDTCKTIISTDKLKINKSIPNSLSNLTKLKNISSQQDAVLIVIWEATHNPLGRAKILYDILQNENRPVMIVGFDFEFSKSGIWEPLLSSAIDLFTVKWNEKETFKQIVDEMDIHFSTIWICKPRLPSFILADMFSDDTTKFILDIDDNEKALSLSEDGKFTPYGKLSNYLAESITEKINAKSVASISIQEKWGGEFVRHAKKSNQNRHNSKNIQPKEKINIGFFGTVRPHKNIEAAAEAIKHFNKHHDTQVQLTVGGHFIPFSLQDEIASHGANTLGEIDNKDLIKMLETMDILITGYPSNRSEDEISKYQISSKIADALSIGKSVLVPEGSSVSDLANIEGIYLFNESNFSTKLQEAISNKNSIKLHKIFELSYNYQQFLKLENIASNQLKKDIFTTPIFSYLPSNRTLVPTLVLVWKQPDSSLYGRRVDQVARSYKRRFPTHRVLIIESVSNQRLAQYETNKNIFVGDDALILDRIKAKHNLLNIEGVEHHMISDADYEDNMRSFLLTQRILPSNSTFILFPIINHYKTLLSLINGYPIVLDVVDNQLAWESQNSQDMVEQYKILSKISNVVLFNSQKNQDFFYEHNLLEKDKKSQLITNWYELPNIPTEHKQTSSNGEIKLFYSGNMNDRIDWELIENLLQALPKEARLYLIGNAQRCIENITELLEVHTNCIYLGPLDERTLVAFISSSHLAIMPHTVELTSRYMNPLKVHMYAAVGVECVSTDVPGLTTDFSGLTVVDDSYEFIKLCLDKIAYLKTNKNKLLNVPMVYTNSRDKYMNLIEQLREGNITDETDTD